MLLNQEWGKVTPELLREANLQEMEFRITGVKLVPHRSRAGHMWILALEVDRQAIELVRHRLGLGMPKTLNPHISLLDKLV